MPNLVIGRNETPKGYLRPDDIPELLSDDTETVVAVFIEGNIHLVSRENSYKYKYYLTTLTGEVVFDSHPFSSLYTYVEQRRGKMLVFDSAEDLIRRGIDEIAKSRETAFMAN